MTLKQENVHNWVYSLDVVSTDSLSSLGYNNVELIDRYYNILIKPEFTGDNLHKYFYEEISSQPILAAFNEYFKKSFKPLFQPLSFADIVVNKIMESEEHQKALETEQEGTVLRIELTPEDFQFYSFGLLDAPKKRSF